MSKHHSADEKLVSRSMRKHQHIVANTATTPNSAPQIPRPVTNSKNQYR